MQKKICDNCGKEFDEKIYAAKEDKFICYDCLELIIDISKLFNKEDWKNAEVLLKKEGIDQLFVDLL